MPDAAAEIHQRNMDAMSVALVSDDRDAFFRGIILPPVIETEAARFVVEDRGAARPHFDQFNKVLKKKVDTCIRIVKTAAFEDAQRTPIHGTHESAAMSSGTLKVPKFAKEATLQLHGGVWASTLTLHFARCVSWPDILPRGTRWAGPGMQDSTETTTP